MKPNKIAPVQRKAEAHLASDPELRESAQRAFQSYLKSVFLMRDKNTFDVFALDTDAFAASLGLAKPPRVRFLQRQIKIREEQGKFNTKVSRNPTGRSHKVTCTL